MIFVINGQFYGEKGFFLPFSGVDGIMKPISFDTKEKRMSAPIVKPSVMTGFPEYLPAERLLEQKMLAKIQAVFERHGFCSIETPVVEKLDVLIILHQNHH